MARLLLLTTALLSAPVAGLRPLGVRVRSMRSRYGRAAMGEDDSGLTNKLKGFFTTNRNTPEAQANQLQWAREQMDLEMPESTLDGMDISDREDFIEKYMLSEKDKFGRDVTREEAEKEIDAWLLRKATFAPQQTTSTDLALAIAVFIVTFGSGLFLSR